MYPIHHQNTALQNYARKNKLPIDTVGFDFVTLGRNPDEFRGAPPEDGIYVHGLFFEGCGWDEERLQLCESRPKALFDPAPVIWLQPKLVSEFSVFSHYDCPVYRTGERRGVLATTGHSTNFMMFMRMPSDQPQWHWVLRGVCMLCSLDSE